MKLLLRLPEQTPSVVALSLVHCSPLSFPPTEISIATYVLVAIHTTCRSFPIPGLSFNIPSHIHIHIHIPSQKFPTPQQLYPLHCSVVAILLSSSPTSHYIHSIHSQVDHKRIRTLIQPLPLCNCFLSDHFPPPSRRCNSG